VEEKVRPAWRVAPEKAFPTRRVVLDKEFPTRRVVLDKEFPTRRVVLEKLRLTRLEKPETERRAPLDTLAKVRWVLRDALETARLTPCVVRERLLPTRRVVLEKLLAARRVALEKARFAPLVALENERPTPRERLEEARLVAWEKLDSERCALRAALEAERLTPLEKLEAERLTLRAALAPARMMPELALLTLCETLRVAREKAWLTLRPIPLKPMTASLSKSENLHELSSPVRTSFLGAASTPLFLAPPASCSTGPMSTIPTKFLSLMTPPRGGAVEERGEAPEERQALMPLVALEAQLEHLPLARSRPVEEGVPVGVKAPRVMGRVVSVPAPPPLTEEELMARLAEAADPLFKEREREPGELVAEGDAVLLSWEARARGTSELLVRQEQAEGRVLPDEELPGFYEALVGKKVGSKVHFSSRLPESVTGGMEADFTVELHRARERTPPDMESPEFFKALGRGGTLEEVMDALGREAVDERDMEMEDEARLALLEQLAQEVQTLLPEEWVTMEMREQWKARQLVARAMGEKAESFDSWQAKPGARREVEMMLRLDLALRALSEQEKVRSGAEDEAQLLEVLAGGVGVEELRKALSTEPSQERLVKKAAWFIRVTDHLMGQVQVKVELPEASAG
jgi:trigger factor